MKIIKVETCGDCPYCSYSYNRVLRCSRADRKAVKRNTIPTWCPLEDPPDAQPEVECPHAEVIYYRGYICKECHVAVNGR